jgi:hypothetical protein
LATDVSLYVFCNISGFAINYYRNEKYSKYLHCKLAAANLAAA